MPQTQGGLRPFFRRIGEDAVFRARGTVASVQNSVVLAIGLLPLASAQTPKDGEIVFEPIQSSTPEIDASVAAVSGWFDINAWNNRGNLIRSGGATRECLGNLSYALATLGELNSAEYSGAAGALSLLPTAGALLGTPTKEMWIVYKLMPLAGVLSMFLSLGGNLMPSKASEYDVNDSFDIRGNTRQKPAQETSQLESSEGDELEHGATQDSRKFVEEIKKRALDDSGGDTYNKIWVGVAAQLCLIGVILIAMWFCQRGAVIPWWCRVSLPLSIF